MCGIAGFLQRRGVASIEIAERQLRLLLHRGPDSIGAFAEGRGVVGQTRLAIIDLVTGDPPITTPDGAIGVALNGEIYNYSALRDELLRSGHQLRTAGDTEVIAHLAEHDEPVAIAPRLDGMFAFAVWDTARQRLVLGRDRLGKKPLYWWCDGTTFVFGSEIKAVLAHPAVTADLDASAIPAYLRFGYVPTPATFFTGIRSVRPGHVLVVDGDLAVREEPYWTLPAPPKLAVSFDEAATLVGDGLRRAVESRLVADVPVGAFLSGGIDSSLVVAHMARARSEPVHTFTIGFEDDEGFDERPYARLVAERYGTDHTEFVVAPHAVDLVERLVDHYDQPFGDSSSVPTFLLSELTAKHVTVALCGDGGDELFAGYERFLGGLAVHRTQALPRGLFRSAAWIAGSAPALGGRTMKVRRLLENAAEGMPDAFMNWISYTPPDLLHQLVGEAGDDPAVAEYRQHWQCSDQRPTLDRLLALTIETYLLDDLLPKVDRMAMAHGLEVRAPFLDHHLVEIAFSLPPKYKARGMTLKRVLRRSATDLLPSEILTRPKRGFGVPLDRWFRDDLNAYVNSRLGTADARIRQHLSGEAVDRVIAQHASGTHRHGHVLWTLLTLEVFLRGRGW